MDGPRPVTPDEFDGLIEMLDEVFTGGRRHMRDAFPLLFNVSNLANLFVIAENGRPVSHAGVLVRDAYVFGCRVTTASIGSVCTLDEYRGRGYASRCLEAAEKKAVEDGASVTLISGYRGMYTRLGAIQVGRSLVADFEAGEPAGGVSIRRAERADIDVLEQLYEREPVRFHRPLEDWENIVSAVEARSRGRHKHGIFIIDSEPGSPAAYVAASRYEWQDGPHIRMDEYAGCRRSIVAALPGVAGALGSEAIKMRAPDWDAPLGALLRAEDVYTAREHLMGHTVKVSSIEHFFHQVQPLMEERVGRSGAGALKCATSLEGLYDCWVGEERLTFEPAAFTALAFGQPETGDRHSRPESVLDRVFPLPLPLAGLNYV